jgi:cleavage and polyadenylation specificity factor subunit 6/7
VQCGKDDRETEITIRDSKMGDTSGVDIDLYADVEDFPNDDLDASGGGGGMEGADGRGGGGGEDLYDDVLAAGAEKNEVKSRARRESEGEGEGSRHGGSGDREYRGRRYQLYVGNLTWWTTDQDIQDSIVALGVNDFLEVKFYENRTNGQSKGFCCVSLGSDASSRIVLEKLTAKELHGQMPVVTHATKQALYQFESQSKTRPTPPSSSGGSGGGGGGSGGGDRGGDRGPPNGRAPEPYNRGPPPPSHYQGRDPPPPRRHEGMRGGPPPHAGLDRPPPPQQQQQQQSHFHGRPPPQQMHGPPPHQQHMPVNVGPPPQLRGPPPPMMAPQPMMHYPHPGGPPPHHMVAGPPLPVHMQRVVVPQHVMHAAPGPGPAPHVNPAFFPQGQPQGPPGGVYPLPMVHAPMPTHGLSEAEFEEIMSRNRTVSSSAIARAVQDAANGEFASAIETLVTAISLIKQSKVAPDDRCMILVHSLQDTLHGIERKSYSRRGRSRERSRERHVGAHHGAPPPAPPPSHRRSSYSREREYHHHHREQRDARGGDREHHYRERSRSRGRDSEREREKYYEDRERYKREERDGGGSREIRRDPREAEPAATGGSSSSRGRVPEMKRDDDERQQARH